MDGYLVLKTSCNGGRREEGEGRRRGKGREEEEGGRGGGYSVESTLHFLLYFHLQRVSDRPLLFGRTQQ